MSVHCKKLAKVSMVLLTVLHEIPDVCSSCFKMKRKSLDCRSRNQGQSNRAFSPSRNFQKHFRLLGGASSCNHFHHPPTKVSAWCGPSC